jgi:hypothetical protein
MADLGIAGFPVVVFEDCAGGGVLPLIALVGRVPSTQYIATSRLPAAMMLFPEVTLSVNHANVVPTSMDTHSRREMLLISNARFAAFFFMIDLLVN